jgi:TonB family protein
LQYDGDGNVTEAKILESPDAAAGQAVLEAVKQWKFAGSKLQDKPINVRGKLTFYFVIDRNGKGEVKNPKQYQ